MNSFGKFCWVFVCLDYSFITFCQQCYYMISSEYFEKEKPRRITFEWAYIYFLAFSLWREPRRTLIRIVWQPSCSVAVAVKLPPASDWATATVAFLSSARCAQETPPKRLYSDSCWDCDCQKASEVDLTI